MKTLSVYGFSFLLQKARCLSSNSITYMMPRLCERFLRKTLCFEFSYFSAKVQPIIMLRSSYCQGKQRDESMDAWTPWSGYESVIKNVKTSSFQVSSTDGYVLIMSLVKALWDSVSPHRVDKASAIKEEVITFTTLQNIHLSVRINTARNDTEPTKRLPMDQFSFSCKLGF